MMYGHQCERNKSEKLNYAIPSAGRNCSSYLGFIIDVSVDISIPLYVYICVIREVNCMHRPQVLHVSFAHIGYSQSAMTKSRA